MDCGWIGWCEMRPEVQAAWVQAVGSIVAILMAVAIPAVQHLLAANVRASERADRARSLGLLLLPYIRTFGDRNNEIWDHEHPDDDVEDVRDNVCIAGKITRAALVIPEEISARIDELHDLGNASNGLQRAVFNVLSAKELLAVEDIPRLDDYGDLTPFSTFVITDKARFYDLMWDALLGIADSQAKIEALFPHSTRPPKPRR